MIELEMAYGYSRVSTDEQGKRGFSIEEQNEEIEKYCERRGIKLKKIFIDEGYSAGTVKRKDFQNLLTAISHKDNQVKILIVRDPSRLIRDLTMKRSINKVFQKFDIKLIYLSHNIDEETPEGALQSDFIALMDESELKRISPRTIKGLKGSALMGNYPIGGKRVPRGYKRVENTQLKKGKRLTIDEEDYKWVVFIFNVLASNRMTVADLVKYLKKNNVFDIHWNRDSLSDIVDNPIYYGRLVTNWFDSEDPNISEEYKQYWYDKEHHTIPIVSKELLMQVQSAIHYYKRKTKHNYLFSRLVYCLDSKEYLVHEPAWKKKSNGDRQLYKYYASAQLKKRINEDKIANAFAVEYSINKLSEINRQIHENLEKEISNKIRRRGFLEEDFDNGYLTEDDYREQIREINIQIIEVKKKLNRIMDNKESFSELSYEKKRAIILSHIKRVDISFKNDTIEFHYIDFR